jgi:hypothetical protein
MTQKSAEWQLLADLLHECSTMVGRSKSTGPAQMVLRTPILASMARLGVLLGHSAIRDLSLTRSQRNAGRALEALASNLWVKLAEAHGVEKAGRESTRTHSKRNSSGKLRLHREAKP